MPCLDRRQAVLNNVLNFNLIFRTAIIPDLESLHNTAKELHERDKNMVHFENNQDDSCTILHASIQLNTMAVQILSQNVKAVMELDG